ncbi:vacuolar-type H+-ATPase subunit H [Xanthomonas arboricola]|uniref:hypothetical protein n=1 Tax=Xanthomonas TaxID=338 RepID=UPI00143132D9|nr:MULTISPECIES: hypothetical protein [Xanthomonas]MDO0789988.1 hypothetical protein [Xanthomonas campestris pv. campestris]MDX6083164.1 hypothetical protein [Xanthomonas campestris pv. incanae]MDX6087355.1 hypothetical protein [Xanthomonas campestris pv. incanae]MDX6140902.1 hypothetical protein [Xanthomonas campestris pv. incanae]NJC38829.1 vacuolar-type H+-ATPase subunit H [Xanthomonas euroxanthea]
MTTIPGKRPINRFTKIYQGSFGQFKTSESFPTQFLLTSLTVNNFDDLTTASEVMDLENYQFDELIQRDIDPERVRDIANRYLAKGKDRPIFFPPLIVCVALMEEGEATRIKPQYQSVSYERVDEGGQEYLVNVFDIDGFRVRLPVADVEHSDRQVLWAEDGNLRPHRYYAYASELALNPARAKLVVLDGQHRLEALRLLTKSQEGREIVAPVELPVCIVWPPGAQVGGSENITVDFRELFVRINSEPRRVSGHFLILLDDKRHSAMAVRELADAWKSEAHGWRRLHLLEWNTRDDERTSRRTRGFSITTISVVSEVLKTYLFEPTGLAPKILDLSSVEDEFLSVDPHFNPHGVSDLRRSPGVSEIMREKMRTTIVPALTILLRRLPPYAQQETRLGQAFARLKQETDGRNLAFTSLAKHLDRFIYEYDGDANGSVQGAYADFRAWAKVPTEHDVFFLSIFQQGLLRMWLRISALRNVSAVEAARITTGAVGAFVADTGSGRTVYLSPDLPYCQRTLWRREKVNIGSDWARLAWSDVLIATMVRKDVRDAAIAELEGEKRVVVAQELETMGITSARRYAARLWEETLRETRNNLGEHFGEEEAGRLRELRKQDLQNFEAVITAASKDRFKVAMQMFSNMLQRREDELYEPA